jgi:DNA-binding CsgD family transcriptional regulator
MDGGQLVSPYSRVSAKATALPGSSRFVFRGDEYWVVAREPSVSDAATQLTPAERHVLALLRAGLTYEQIAASRGRSRHTVAKQITSVLRKLDVSSQRELELPR